MDLLEGEVNNLDELQARERRGLAVMRSEPGNPAWESRITIM
jgi:hypothetical protein